MEMAEVGGSRAWIEVSLAAIRANLRLLGHRAGDLPSIAVVKADAYGHGLERVCQALARDAAMFGVAAVSEAAVVQQTLGKGAPPILLLGAVLAEDLPTVVRHGWHLSLSTKEELALVAAESARQRSQASVHLVVDTGMGRIGALESDFLGLCRAATEQKNIRVCGLASHLPSADEDEAFTQDQLERINALMREALQEFEFNPGIHIQNSAGICRFPSAGAQWVRPGLAMYGCSPDPSFQEGLFPALTLKARVRLVRELPMGHGISYGRTFITKRPTRVATVGIGYGDGYRHSLSGQSAKVLIGGQKCPILGRVTMDQTMVDVTDLPTMTSAGEEVVLLGRQGEEEIGLWDIARKVGTIPWEILTGFTKRLPRIYDEET